ncbi:hypothetical protein JNB_05375 [Janibacter sp. HTCC2649]|nr:hypothetical protein JNB_05375 [Janibacter sp. HTCC2649]
MLGVPVAVECFGSRRETLADAVHLAWAWCTTTDDVAPVVTVQAMLDPDPGVLAEASAAGMVAHSDEAVMEDWLTPHITRAAMEHLAGQVLMLHACVVAHPVTGAAAVLVGRSGAGKTTLARSLGARLAYVTDETAAIEADHGIRPFAKPLSLHRDGGSLKVQLAPDSLHLTAPGPGPLRAAAVVLVNRDPGHVGLPTVESVPTLEALSSLAEHTSHLKRLEAPLHRLAHLLAACGGLQRLTYREATDVTALVSSLVEAR